MMIARISLALLLLLIPPALVAANAADTTGADQGSGWVDPGWRRTVSRYKVSFDEQGLSTVVFDFEIQALDEKGAEAIWRQVVAYNSYFSELTSDDLATLKVDVTEISADLDAGEKAFHAGNYSLAMARLKPFAEDGNARAQAFVGTMYETGRGVERDYREAMRWFLMPAEQGDAYSQSHVGYLYEEGLGVARDEELAAQWYAKAADQGFAWAQMSLGLLYVNGRGVPQDFTKAIFWLRNAADRNDSRAQYNLGWAYESGTGVAKDTQQAIAWYGRAADAGEPQARARLERLTGGVWRGLFHYIGLFGLAGGVIAEILEWLWHAV